MTQPTHAARTLFDIDHGSRPHALEVAIILAAVLIVPIAMYVSHLAPYARWLYTLTNVLVAGWLYARRSPWYEGHCLLVFFCVSLVRRLVDEQAGWDPSNPVLLTPYLCCLYTVCSFFSYWARPSPRYFGLFLGMLLSIGYGVLLAMLHERILGSLVDALKWSIGPLFAVHVLARREQLAAMRAIVGSCLIWGGTAMSLYGVVQFVNPPTWDAAWMLNVAELGLDSIGTPDPFRVRVFSTMNSPGSFGIMLTAGIVLGLSRRMPVAAPTVALMIIGLALCQYRSIWAATVLAVLMGLSSGGKSLRPTNVLTVLVIFLALASTAVMPRIREVVVSRASSLTALKHDKSLESRLHQYAMLTHADGLVLGEGLAINGASRRLDRELPVHLDGALIEIWRAMGVIVGTLFLFTLLAPIVVLFRVPPGWSRHVLLDRALVVATFIQLPIGTVHTGELGFCAWMFLGFGLATCLTASSQPQSRSTRDTRQPMRDWTPASAALTLRARRC